MKLNLEKAPMIEVEVLALSLRCPDCGHEWRARLDGKELEELPISRFLCEKCSQMNRSVNTRSNKLT